MDHSKLEKLIHAVATGDERAFAKLYKLTSAKLYAVSMRMMREESQAQEVLQDAYTSIWRNASVFARERGHAITWMSSIVRYRALDMLRRNKRDMDSDGEVETLMDDRPDADPAWANMQTDDARRLQECLDELPESQRRCVTLSFVYGYTHEELSDKLDSPLGTIKSWVRRGLEKLKNCLTL